MVLKPMSEKTVSVCKDCTDSYPGCKRKCQKRIREMLKMEVLAKRRKKALLELKANDYFCVDHEKYNYYKGKLK